MKVKILEGRPGSPDGVAVIKYKKGEVVDMSAHLAKTFIAEGWAELLVEAPVQPVSAPATKMVTGAPENKEQATKDEDKTPTKAGRRA